jgi:alanine racemase
MAIAKTVRRSQLPLRDRRLPALSMKRLYAPIWPSFATKFPGGARIAADSPDPEMRVRGWEMAVLTRRRVAGEQPFCSLVVFSLLSMAVPDMQRGIQFAGRPVWAEVRLSALAHNLRAIRRHVNSPAAVKGGGRKKHTILCVVKGDGYGHGAVPVAKALSRAGADWFGVTDTTEGIELRDGGIREPILVLTGFWEGEEKHLVERELTPVITRCGQLPLLERAARKSRKPVPFHLKIETGMNRLGISPSDVPCFARTLAESPHLCLQGLFTHFASSEIFTNEVTERQRQVFEQTIDRLRALGITAPLVHMANSAAVALRPGTWGNMVRPGLVLYGYHQRYEPTERTAEANVALQLRPALALRSRIISLRDVATGQGVGYNHRWIASRPSRVAVLAAGYADGLPRTLTNRGRVIVRGKFAPMVGTVSMDLITVDVTDIPEVEFGDVVTIYGKDGECAQYVDEVADIVGTVASDLCCALGKRVPRFYLP